MHSDEVERIAAIAFARLNINLKVIYECFDVEKLCDDRRHFGGRLAYRL